MIRWLVLLFSLALCVCAWGGEVEVTFNSSLDGSAQKALAYVPNGLLAGEKRPLLALAHPFGGSSTFGRALGYYAECEKRGWLLITPDLHGHKKGGDKSFAAREAQRDILDAIAYMEAHYAVDSSRIFLAGRSMGGMLAEMMAAKYPQRFAAVCAGQGISDLAAWVKESPQFRDPVVEECGKPGKDTAFEYARRSAINYAPNFAYVPLILWHGTNDTWVLPAQSSRLRDAIAKFDPYTPAVNWLRGAAHCPTNYPAAWECDQLQYFQNACEAGMDLPTRYFPRLELVFDEESAIFWLKATPRPETFAHLTAEIRDGTLTITAKNATALEVNLADTPTGTKLTRYTVETDTPLTLTLRRGDKVEKTAPVNRKGAGEILP